MPRMLLLVGLFICLSVCEPFLSRYVDDLDFIRLTTEIGEARKLVNSTEDSRTILFFWIELESTLRLSGEDVKLYVKCSNATACNYRYSRLVKLFERLLQDAEKGKVFLAAKLPKGVIQTILLSNFTRMQLAVSRAALATPRFFGSVFVAWVSISVGGFIILYCVGLIVAAKLLRLSLNARPYIGVLVVIILMAVCRLLAGLMGIVGSGPQFPSRPFIPAAVLSDMVIVIGNAALWYFLYRSAL